MVATSAIGSGFASCLTRPQHYLYIQFMAMNSIHQKKGRDESIQNKCVRKDSGHLLHTPSISTLVSADSFFFFLFGRQLSFTLGWKWWIQKERFSSYVYYDPLLSTGWCSGGGGTPFWSTKRVRENAACILTHLTVFTFFEEEQGGKFLGTYAW